MTMSFTSAVSTPPHFVKWPLPQRAHTPAPAVGHGNSTGATACPEAKECQVVPYQAPLSLAHRIIADRHRLYKVSPKIEERSPANVAWIYQKNAEMNIGDLGNRIDIRV